MTESPAVVEPPATPAPPPALHDRVRALLDSLGEESATVATAMAAANVHGERGSPLTHPLCRWLARQEPDLGCRLSADAVYVFRRGAGESYESAIVPMPPPVHAWCDEFDAGRHPALELHLDLPPPLARRVVVDPADPLGVAPVTPVAPNAEHREPGRDRHIGTAPVPALVERPVAEPPVAPPEGSLASRPGRIPRPFWADAEPHSTPVST